MNESLTQERKKYLGDSCALFYSETPLCILKGEGAYMYDENNRPYLDCINNVATVGHCHRQVVEACNQQKQLIETNSRYLHPNIIQLATKLSKTLPSQLHKFYFLNSGSESTDLALLLSFYCTKGTEVIVLDHAYHGHLMSAMSISPYKFNKPGGIGKKDWVHIAPCPDIYRGKYNVFNTTKSDDTKHLSEINELEDPRFSHADFGKLYADEVIKIIEEIQSKGKKLAAFICESMISCGGQILLPPNFLKIVYKAVRDAGGICIADEVQAGFGRCGKHFWAFELSQVEPDIVTMGKPMGNGHPVAALVTTEHISKTYASNHVEYFNTYGGNPVSCAVALAVLDVIEKEKLAENSWAVGSYLKNKLCELQSEFSNIIGDVRGIGLFIGVELVKDPVTREPATQIADTIVYKMKDKGVIISHEGPYGNVLKIKPPLCFNQKDADILTTNLRTVLKDMINT